MGLSGLAYIDQQEMLKAACRVGNLNSQQVNASLMRLYSQYAMEWQTIRPTIGILPTSTFSDYSKNQEALTI